MLKKLKQQKGFWIGIGIMIGSIIGAITDNIGIWLPVGLAIGVGLETTQKKGKKTDLLNQNALINFRGFLKYRHIFFIKFKYFEFL